MISNVIKTCIGKKGKPVWAHMEAWLHSNTCRKIIRFCFWGVLTTAVNVVVYLLCRKVGIAVSLSTTLAWFLSVLFAYVTNKLYVFDSHVHRLKAIWRELWMFYSSRLLSGLLDIAIMYVLVTLLKSNELLAKIIDELAVSAMNFMFSFLVVFRKR